METIPAPDVQDRTDEAAPRHAGLSNSDVAAEVLAYLGKKSRTFRSGSKLTFEGDEVHSVMILLDGWLALSKSLPDGQTQIIDFILPGDIVAPAGADGKSSAWQVEATTDATLTLLGTADWNWMKQKWPSLQDLESNLAAMARARISERMLRLGKGSAQMRVAYALLELGIRLRALDEQNDSSFHIPLTQQRLGEFVGLSSVHVCRTLRRLAGHKLITTQDHMNIHVIDLHALAALAGVQIDDLRREIEPSRPALRLPL